MQKCKTNQISIWIYEGTKSTGFYNIDLKNFKYTPL